jgi:glycine/D-amino acid oxidase-like deaminating enzyme
MQRADIRSIVGVALLMAGAIALVGGFGVTTGEAADPDRYIIHESDHFDEELEMRIERALGRLEDLESFEAFGDDMEEFGEELAAMIEELLDETAVHIDRDWPDVVYVGPDDGSFSIDTRDLARDIDRMARRIERDVVRSLERSRIDGRVWNVERDRATIESEMRDLEREMNRLQRELDHLEEEGDI